MPRKKISLWLLFFLIFVSFALPKSLGKDLSISLKAKRIREFSTSGLSLVFYINIANSSSSSYYLSKYDYRFVVNQQEYLQLQTSLEEQIEIGAKGDSLISLPVKITYTHLFEIVKEAEEYNKAQCYLTGGMTFSDGRKEKGRLPFAFSGEFPIFKPPELDIVSLKVQEITIGGADLAFDISFENRNVFELIVDRISYRLNLGEKPIGRGEISGDKNIKSLDKRVFLLPVLVEFFDVGKDVYNALHQPSVTCSVTGEVEIRTVWGRLKVPFGKSKKINISRTS
ncbi:MAG: LEA type 2 family protein [Candidatus Aminicenantes bacterium]|nr:MAG: LEA type 2 family protein [Candidatus Aminicenantes bacterium]